MIEFTITEQDYKKFKKDKVAQRLIFFQGVNNLFWLKLLITCVGTNLFNESLSNFYWYNPSYNAILINSLFAIILFSFCIFFYNHNQYGGYLDNVIKIGDKIKIYNNDIYINDKCQFIKKSFITEYNYLYYTKNNLIVYINKQKCTGASF